MFRLLDYGTLPELSEFEAHVRIAEDPIDPDRGLCWPEGAYYRWTLLGLDGKVLDACLNPPPGHVGIWNPTEGVDEAGVRDPRSMHGFLTRCMELVNEHSCRGNCPHIDMERADYHEDGDCPGECGCLSVAAEELMSSILITLGIEWV